MERGENQLSGSMWPGPAQPERHLPSSLDHLRISQQESSLGPMGRRNHIPLRCPRPSSWDLPICQVTRRGQFCCRGVKAAN